MAHCVGEDLQMSHGIARRFRSMVGKVDELKWKNGGVGQVLELRHYQRLAYYLITKQKSYQKAMYRTV